MRSQKKLGILRDAFVESAIPYKVDIMDFDNADKNFRCLLPMMRRSIMVYMKVEDIQAEVVRIVRSRLGDAHQVLLFGSWARGDALPQSDVDIGVYGTQEVSWPLMAQIRHAVDELPTLRKIDIVDLRAKSTAFQEAILAYARPLSAE